jgi:MEDS: MEthanogen/methylotroph, DcmR Sensory domain
MPPLLTKLGNRFPIRRHEHVAVLYRGGGDAFRFASFLSEGLKNGDLCYYLASEGLHRGMLGALRELGVNHGRCLASGRLTLDSGTADWWALEKRLPRAVARAERAEAPAVRWLEEGGWWPAAGLSAARYHEFHSLLNLQVKHYPGAAVCQYAVDALEPSQLAAAIAVHRHLIIENTFVRDNPFYISPERFLRKSPAERDQNAAEILREVGFDVGRLLENLAGYGHL